MDTESEIQQLKARNSKVELDKAWETSWTRRLFIAGMTYGVAGLWMMTIGDSHPWLKAFVPAGGYVLSTLSLPFAKKWWAHNHS